MDSLMGTGFSTLSQSQVKETIEKMRKKSKELSKTRETAREFLIRHGFITKSGKLTKHYR
jgi:hypothetical protein